MGACAVWGQHVCAEPCTRCGIGPVRFLADASGAARACVADDEHAVPAGGGGRGAATWTRASRAGLRRQRGAVRLFLRAAAGLVRRLGRAVPADLRRPAVPCTSSPANCRRRCCPNRSWPRPAPSCMPPSARAARCTSWAWTTA
ncbi:hypothetical protein G6F23_014234 [Rhizopus arrhizus]|nr:hypothetical protein G6F23_014234 [Rhizopus arrhizus]